MLFQRLLKSTIKKGTLRLITANGVTTVYGNGELPRTAIKLHQPYLEWSLAFFPQLRVCEAYMDGLLTIEEGTLRDFIHVCLINYKNIKHQALFDGLNRLTHKIKDLLAFSSIRKARKDVSSHYDLPPQLYDLFLDTDRQYSCGYFLNPQVSLEQAQEDKKRHIASKLRLKNGLKVLDIGSGWGGLCLYLALETGCDTTGITLSHEQFALSNKRAQNAGLAQSCRFALRDFRQEQGHYDRIVSVGMFEHVGEENYAAFFSKVRELLADDGICLLHSIGRFESGVSYDPFIRKYIFPGAELPSLSTVMRHIEKAGLFVTDVEVLRLHYAHTLQRWAERFKARRAKAVQLFGERFCRMWELYLVSCEMSFQLGHLMVFQIQLSKTVSALPITRDYMHEWEEIVTGLPRITAKLKNYLNRLK